MPELWPLVERAVMRVQYPGTTPQAFYLELVDRIADPNLGIFVGRDPDPKAFVVGMLPNSAFMMGPQVIIAYNEGHPKLARGLGRAMREWILSEGYDSAYSCNLQHSGGMFRRVFRHFGMASLRAGLFTFRLK